MLSVIDTNWHTFMDNGGTDTETCLTCGGTWSFTDVVSDPVEFPNSVERTYHASNGDAPERCSGDTARVHGETPCQTDNGRECEEARTSDDGMCKHTKHDCNCVMCTG